MEQKVIEIARGVAKTSTFATKNEALRFAKSEGGAAIGIYENGGMYMFAFGAYKPQMVYSKLVYEFKKAYNTGVHRTYTTDDGVFVAYMPLRKKMRRHGHGSPVPPPSIDIVFIGNENAALLSGAESDLLWDEETESISAGVFVKSTAYDKIAQPVIEVDGIQISVEELGKMSIAEAKEEAPSLIVPQGFGDSDYFISYSADNVEDITEGDKAKVVLIDSEGEEFAQTNEKKIHIIPVTQPDYLSFTGEAENAKLMMSVYAEAEEPEMPDIEYSTDKTNWHQVGFTKAEDDEFVYLSPEFTLGVGETIYFKGENPNGLNVVDSETRESVRDFNFIIEGGAVSAGGDVGTLTDGVGGAGVALTDYCYSAMFDGCTSLTSAPALPATTLADYCYYSMFDGCTSLTSAPALPAATLADYCYDAMFEGCTSLTSAPALPATTLADYCYYSMFDGCTSLTSAPALPATTLAEGCYDAMFEGCTSLTSAPALPATTLADYCYEYMFSGCTSLTSAPALPATTLADYCYEYMFDGCTSLTSAPALPATTLAEGCYDAMFEGCTSLTSAPALPATTLADYCYECMFSGCTSLTSAPALPATTLADYCYYSMFEGCTSLTSAPALPATTLAEGCYDAMFEGCTFDMSDDGTTFNFEFGATLPQTVGEVTYSTHKDVAEWMGNTNGFN